MRDRTTYGDRVSIRESNQRAPIPWTLVPWMIRLESSRISYLGCLVLARGQRELRRVRLCTKRTMRSRFRSVDALVRSIRRIKQAIRR